MKAYRLSDYQEPKFRTLIADMAKDVTEALDEHQVSTAYGAGEFIGCGVSDDGNGLDLNIEISTASGIKTFRRGPAVKLGSVSFEKADEELVGGYIAAYDGAYAEWQEEVAKARQNLHDRAAKAQA